MNLRMFYRYYIVLVTLFTLVSISFLLSLNSVFSQDGNEFFEVPEDEFFNPEDYGNKSTLSSDEGNYSEQFKIEDELYITNSEKLTGLINLTDFNFALAGDWGCTKNTAKTVELIQSYDPELVFSLGDTSYEPDINCWVDIVKPISEESRNW